MTGTKYTPEAPWGTPEIHDFFDRWTKRLVVGGVYRAYLHMSNWATDKNLSGEDSAQHFHGSVRTELPLVVALTEYLGVVSEQMQSRKPVGLYKVDPETGKVLASSSVRVATLRPDGTMVSSRPLVWQAVDEHTGKIPQGPGIEDDMTRLTVEQIDLVHQQLLEQNDLGITPTFPAGASTFFTNVVPRDRLIMR